MSSLRERLAAKARRRVTVPIAVKNSDGAVSRAQSLRVQENLARMRNQEEQAEEFRVQAETAEAEVREAYEPVEFQTADPVDFEKLQATYFNATDDEPVDVDSALPELLAACAVDEDLRDAEWWVSQFKAGAWSFGERNDLWRRLLNLNSQAPDPRIPFD